MVTEDDASQFFKKLTKSNVRYGQQALVNKVALSEVDEEQVPPDSLINYVKVSKVNNLNCHDATFTGAEPADTVANWSVKLVAYAINGVGA